MGTESELTYVPIYARHVTGKYSPRSYEDGKPLPQEVEATCGVCKAVYRARCMQGQPRAHVSRFAQIHLHRDPIRAVRVPR